MAKIGRTVTLVGGVEGARWAGAMVAHLPAAEQTFVVNTGDDFSFVGLHLSPDLDAVMYTLAGRVNPTTGWGLANDTLSAMTMLSDYGAARWFRLGDGDIATHIVRTQRLRDGLALTDVTAELAAAIGVESRLLPMCDQPVATVAHTRANELRRAAYWYANQPMPEVVATSYIGVKAAQVSAEVAEAVRKADAVIIAPANPISSIGPILAVAGMRELIGNLRKPRVAVSAVVAGRLLEAGAERVLEAEAEEVSPYGVAQLYAGLIDGLVIDERDAEQEAAIRALGIRVLVTHIDTADEGERIRLAGETLGFASGVISNELLYQSLAFNH